MASCVAGELIHREIATFLDWSWVRAELALRLSDGQALENDGTDSRRAPREARVTRRCFSHERLWPQHLPQPDIGNSKLRSASLIHDAQAERSTRESHEASQQDRNAERENALTLPQEL